uniref:Uncharacterized protein n=1 Tax=Caenorhabditis japonica TaxID=281687 RepID=A0A8R1IE10_CAEJA
MQLSTLVVLFALCAISATSPLWFDEEEPMNLRAFRMMPNQYEQLDSIRRLPKRASVFNKRRGRELFGKRALPIEYPEENVMYENRFRRRANELFG